ncbi:MAG TPA: hypothetical protein VGZ47_08425 [Gemmataceae bacterium]|nr:hypothetical protein [Gemmataceae bacterium]
MPRNAGIPAYSKHSSGQARVRLTDAVTGRRKDVLLGKYGKRASKEEYGCVIQQWEAVGRRLLEADPQDITINELAVAYVEYATGHYKPNETGLCGDMENIKQAIKLLRQSFGHERVSDFGPKRLKIVCNAMVARNWCRAACNRQIDRLRRMFKWGTEEELIPPSIYHGLRAVEPLRRGAQGVRDKAGVKPVPVATVEATKPFMAPDVAKMVDMQLLTGTRRVSTASALETQWRCSHS